MDEAIQNQLKAEGWRACAEELPPEGEVVVTRIHDEHGPRNQQKLQLQGRLWWYDDMSMYVYYTPTHWKPLPNGTAKEEN